MRLDEPFTLRCGQVLPNRLCKSALTEGLADCWSRSTPELEELYLRWSHGGCGLLITGNVQVDRRYVERPGNVAIDGPQDEEQVARLRALAKASMAGGNQCWVQLSHAGRQSNIKVNYHPVGPSAVAVQSAPGMLGMPRELTAAEVEDVLQRFAYAAKICKQAGFSGVQLHSAHGYLLSSFLSPLYNKRTD
eukprot:RCo003047